MACCTRYCAAEAHFSTKMAQRDLRRYQRRGAEGVTRILLAELRRWPLQDKHLLDVGSGIGVVSAELADNGVADATLVEASPAYLEAARGHIASRYTPPPTHFVLGDFTKMVDTLPDADVVALDRVVCCYPDADGLLQAAASRTRHLLTLTYPRDRRYVRGVIAVQNVVRRLKGNAFRVLVHSPEQMRATLKSAGFVRTAGRETLVWGMELHRRS